MIAFTVARFPRCLMTGRTKQFFRTMCSKSEISAMYSFQTLKVESPCQHVLHVEINRPEKRNAINSELWKELHECFNRISCDKNCRSVILSGAGKLFSAGIDFTDLGEIASVIQSSEEAQRKAFSLYQKIRMYQDSFTSVEKCVKPVIVAVHGGCIGGGVDLVTCADIRYCTQDAYFQVKEVELGLAADVGTLQRLPRIVGNDSFAREMIYTARKVDADESKRIGIVSRVYPDKDNMMKEAIDTASCIASKSPLAVQGSKINVLYSRDHSVDDSLEFTARWNMYALQSEDVMKAGMAAVSKSEPPVFSNL